MVAILRKYLLAGLLVWLPIWATILVLHFLIDTMDKTLTLLPYNYQPNQLLGFHIPGLGVIVTVLVLFTTGLIATNVLGKYLLSFWDRLVSRIPLVRSIYNGVKHTIDTVMSSKGQSFRKVLLVEYPREGLWSLAFQTGTGCKEVCEKLGQEDMVTIFIPTTPNPTSGFLMMVARSQVKELDMSVDEALKMIISLGVVRPSRKKSRCQTPATP